MPSGSESVVHNFTGKAGGYFPDENLTAVGGTLYGTTMWGFGKKGGIVFEFTP
jgi:hypothetical protein